MFYEEFQELYQRCTSGNCTLEEQKLFEEYRDSFDLSDTPWHSEFGDRSEIEKKLKSDLYARIFDNKVKRINFSRWAAAAAVLVFFLSAIFLAVRYFRQKGAASYTGDMDKNAIRPGSEIAVLTLADGSRLNLDKSRIGKLFSVQRVSAENTSDGNLIYQIRPKVRTYSTQLYNVVTTPKGGKYRLTLADGTKVWLNAASSIRYPVEFAGATREVELKGEAYFEVAHDAGRPFKVNSGEQVVQVLGTHFDINAYKDEDAVKTTLLEGRVEVRQKGRRKSGANLVIAPNEQAVFKNEHLEKITVDAGEFTTWTSGRIVFKDADIHEVMRKISRWYNVEVVYEGQLNGDTYNGEIPDNAAFSKVIQMLKLDDIHVKVIGRKLIVSQ
ncbi:DUF4974 domain-containing protein [Mucilaginibacter sp. HC2]|uniref:FecR family protein n=1 Tax=Mucilaginibacter inviolabilis TaxID=2714892 RepID=UPI0014072470|nr:FecR family protein [Mucilaginibacter inviolabilis]NHA07386.1 DUF4974 domain-containing protein [Mucilaginibacter inviolabilis]